MEDPVPYGMPEKTFSLDLTEFNEQCKKLGYPPYPVGKITFEMVDRASLAASIQHVERQLAEWLEACKKSSSSHNEQFNKKPTSI